ncbi:transglutaminase family protein [Georgenia ruanii]|nr:transglutaminase family protein [Georgenia ruanii]MPV88021.1 transglutaminase family protein [Georgenia ruanii]
MSRPSARRGGEERHVRLVHRSTYTYPAPVTGSYGVAMLLPRAGAGQRVHAADLAVTPGPAEASDHLDLHGNRVGYFHVTEPHTTLEVCATSVVSVARRRLDPAAALPVTWERAAASVSGMRATGIGEHGEGPASVLAIVESALPSELIAPEESVREYAMSSFGPGTPLVHVVAGLSRRLREDVGDAPPGREGPAPLPEVLARRAGSSHDRAHLLVACMRSMGLAARYVSGYVAPPEAAAEAGGAGQGPRAWASVWLPGGGWIHVDPTADQFIDNRYVILGWGRDHHDVAPLRGVVFGGGAGSSVRTEVRITPAAAHDLAAAVRPATT